MTTSIPSVGQRTQRFTPGFSPEEKLAAKRAVEIAVDEDLAYGSDATSMATVPPDSLAKAKFTSRHHGVVAGMEVIPMVLDRVLGEGQYKLSQHCGDGDHVAPGSVLAKISASTRGLLTAERTALNLLCHLSGIASETARWVSEIEGTSCTIRDTRKTLPGLRLIQKYAVRAGGGANHRLGLGDAVLIKDNHVVAAGGVTQALEMVRARCPELPCEVEVDSLEQLEQMLAAGVDLVLLDNFPVWQTQAAVQRRNRLSPDTRLESSGGLSLETAADYARTGVDYLAVGALTHSVSVLDIGLDM